MVLKYATFCFHGHLRKLKTVYLRPFVEVSTSSLKRYDLPYETNNSSPFFTFLIAIICALLALFVAILQFFFRGLWLINVPTPRARAPSSFLPRNSTPQGAVLSPYRSSSVCCEIISPLYWQTTLPLLNTTIVRSSIFPLLANRPSPAFGIVEVFICKNF